MRFRIPPRPARRAPAPIVVILLMLAACAEGSRAAPALGPGPGAFASGMVAAANPMAVEAGLEVLRQGGGAVDAAVAVQATLGLVEPQSSGLGGGAFLIHFDAQTGAVAAYDGRETAPGAAGPGLFLDESGAPIPFPEARTGGRAVGVPGVVAMLGAAHADHGRLRWAALFDGAIALAEDGFPTPARMSAAIAQGARFGPLAERPATRALFFTPDGAPLAAGAVATNRDYARTLRLLAAEGPAAFHRGALAQAMLEAVSAPPLPGAMTLADIAGYAPRTAPAMCAPYRVWIVCSAPPPSSGGVMLNAALGMLERFPLAETGPDDARSWHVVIEALRLAYADRDLYVADPQFVDTPTAGLIDPAYLAARAALIDPARAMARAQAGRPPGAPARAPDTTAEAAGTTHFVVVDGFGDVVSMTSSVEAAMGAMRVAGGFLLNNQMTDFAREATAPGSAIPANGPEGGKRPRSSMSPVIVLDGETGAFVLAVGSPGGNSIPSYVLKALVAMLDWGMTPQQAADLPNIVARGDRTQIETGFDPAMLAGLRAMGHDIVETRGENSGLHAVRALPDGTLAGAADSRREGVAQTP